MRETKESLFNETYAYVYETYALCSSAKICNASYNQRKTFLIFP